MTSMQEAQNLCVIDIGGLLAAEILAPPAVMKRRLATQVQALWGAVRQRSIFLPAVFVFLWQVSCQCSNNKAAWRHILQISA